MNRFTALASLLVPLTVLAGCADDSEDPARLRVFLTTQATLMDAPNPSMDGPMETVLVQPVALEVRHETEGWFLVWDDSVMIDLLSENNWKPIALGDTLLPAGSYDAMRWTFGMTQVVDPGGTHVLTLDGADGQELEIPTSFCLEPAGVDHLHLEWHAEGALEFDPDAGYSLTPDIQSVMPPTCGE